MAALSSRTLTNVATPFTEWATVSPRSESPLGLAPSDRMTRVSRRVTWPAESWTVTCTGGLIGSPARAPLGGEENATRAGGASDGGVFTPFSSLSRWQLTATAHSVATARVVHRGALLLDRAVTGFAARGAPSRRTRSSRESQSLSRGS